jgi:hypothetical protein
MKEIHRKKSFPLYEGSRYQVTKNSSIVASALTKSVLIMFVSLLSVTFTHTFLTKTLDSGPGTKQATLVGVE